VIPVMLSFPNTTGEFRIRAELFEQEHLVAFSEKVAHILEPVEKAARPRPERIAVIDANAEIATFLKLRRLDVESFSPKNIKEYDVIVANEGEVRSKVFQNGFDAFKKFLEEGKTIVLVEPERGIESNENLLVAPGVVLQIQKRKDDGRGGYDSYVFAEDINHALWDGITQERLKMFNGGYGGEVVSQHDVTTDSEHVVMARCGLKLGVPAVFVIPVGRGKIIVSRLQLRGRLAETATENDPFARRIDPVLQRYLLNLLGYALGEKRD
jgi:hypothetical protein